MNNFIGTKMTLSMHILYYIGNKPKKVVNVIRKWEIIENYEMEELHNFAVEKYVNFGGNMEDPDYINIWLSKDDIIHFKNGLHRMDEYNKDKYERICDNILSKIEEGYKCIYGSERKGPWG